jgi:hypothetical protein
MKAAACAPPSAFAFAVLQTQSGNERVLWRDRVNSPGPKKRMSTETLLPSFAGWRIFAPAGPLPRESDMKGLEKKKETKKKPQKSLKEKRAEKNAKKADRT